MMKLGKLLAVSAAATALSATLVMAGGPTIPSTGNAVPQSTQVHRDVFITTRINTGGGAGGTLSAFVQGILNSYQ